jgi:hypothetical protein
VDILAATMNNEPYHRSSNRAAANEVNTFSFPFPSHLLQIIVYILRHHEDLVDSRFCAEDGVLPSQVLYANRESLGDYIKLASSFPKWNELFRSFYSLGVVAHPDAVQLGIWGSEMSVEGKSFTYHLFISD